LTYDNILNAYRSVKITDTDIGYFQIEAKEERFFYDSASTVHRKIFRSYRDNLKRIINLLDGYNHIEEGSDEYFILENATNEAKMYFPEIFQAIDMELIDRLAECYTKDEAVKLIRAELISKYDDCMPFIEDLRNEFPENSVWKGQDLKDSFAETATKYNLPISATIIILKTYMEISDRFK